eukprot:s13_g38.t1
MLPVGLFSTCQNLSPGSPRLTIRKDTAIALDGLAHNFYFTLELHTTFVYKSGDEFTFRGDDDVWVFMRLAALGEGQIHLPMKRPSKLIVSMSPRAARCR